MRTTRRAILFDIDGTLMRAGGAGRQGLVAAAIRFYGVPQETAEAEIGAIDFRGATDAQILAEMSARLGVDVDAEQQAFMTCYLEELDRCLLTAVIERLPGVHDLVAVLEQNPNLQVGLCTGNVRPAARRKLDEVQLGHLVEGPGGFGEDGRERSMLARAAVERLRRVGVDPRCVLVIGDTPHDVHAAHAAGAVGVAVATGWTPKSELERCGAALVLDDLSDPAPVLNLLGTLEARA